MTKRNILISLFSCSSRLTRGTKETRVPEDTGHPAQLTSCLPATLGINGEVKCCHATLPRMPKNVCASHLPLLHHMCCSQAALFQDFFVNVCLCLPPSLWFLLFLYLCHNDLPAVSVYVWPWQPTKCTSLLMRLCTRSECSFSDKHESSNGFRKDVEIPASRAALRSSLTEPRQLRKGGQKGDLISS